MHWYTVSFNVSTFICIFVFLSYWKWCHIWRQLVFWIGSLKFFLWCLWRHLVLWVFLWHSWIAWTKTFSPFWAHPTLKFTNELQKSQTDWRKWVFIMTSDNFYQSHPHINEWFENWQPNNSLSYTFVHILAEIHTHAKIINEDCRN